MGNIAFQVNCGTLRIKLVPRAINYQKISVKAIKKRAREKTIDAEKTKKTKEARKIKKAGGIVSNIVISNILLINSYLYLYNSVHRILITSYTINQIATIS